LEEVHDTECKDKRDEKIKEMYNKGITQIEIGKLLGISVATVFQVVHENVWNSALGKYERQLIMLKYYKPQNQSIITPQSILP
jgi:DNA invertase Pin-like site-specific DNA recombinase